MEMERNDYTYTWMTYPVNGGVPTVIGDGGDLITRADADGIDSGAPVDPVAQWSVDGRWLIYIKKANGVIGIWRSSRDGRVVERLTSDRADVIDFRVLDASTIVFSTDKPRAELRAQSKVRAQEGFLWDDRFDPVYSRLPLPDTGSQVHLRAVQVDGTQERDASAQETAEWYQATGASHSSRTTGSVLSRSGKRVAMLKALDPKLQGARPPRTLEVAASSDSTNAVVCRAAACTGTISDIWWGADDNQIYFMRHEGYDESHRAIYQWTIHGNRVRLIYETANYLTACKFLDKGLICLLETPVEPRRIVSLNFKEGVLKTGYDPNPEFKAVHLTRVQKVEWRDVYGDATFGHLVYPADYSDRRYPLVIVQYRSRGFLRGGTGGEYPIHVFAANGYFVLSWNRPESFEVQAKLTADEIQKRRVSDNHEYISAVSALTYVIDALSERGLIDPARVGITGLSNGAQAVRVGIIHTTKFAAAIMSQANGAPLSYYLLSDKFRTYLRFYGMTAPDGSREAHAFWDYQSIASNVDKIDTPILMLLNESEMLHAAQNIVALKEAGRAVEAYVYPNAFHIKTQPRQIESSMVRSVDWFNFWLRGVEDSDSTKAAQYVRWEALRHEQAELLASRRKNGVAVNPLPPIVKTDKVREGNPLAERRIP